MLDVQQYIVVRDFLMYEDDSIVLYVFVVQECLVCFVLEEIGIWKYLFLGWFTCSGLLSNE